MQRIRYEIPILTPPTFIIITSTIILGVILRDSRGIAQVKSITGTKVLRILRSVGLAPEIPEDLYCLIKKAVSMRKHLSTNKNDKDCKFRYDLFKFHQLLLNFFVYAFEVLI